MIDYSTFKTFQILLFFGSAFGFCLWQLAAVRRMRRERIRVEQGKRGPAAFEDSRR